MQAVVTSGTAAGVGFGPGIYAKTGTADIQGQEQPNSWLIAFDPAKDIAVGCLVVNAGYGASYDGPEVKAPRPGLGEPGRQRRPPPCGRTRPPGQRAVGRGEQAGLQHEVVPHARPPGVGHVRPSGRGAGGQKLGVRGEQLARPGLDQQRRQPGVRGQQRRDRSVEQVCGAAYACAQASSHSGLSSTSRRTRAGSARRSRPRSSQGDSRIQPNGRGCSSSRRARSTARARPPPAESPTLRRNPPRPCRSARPGPLGHPGAPPMGMLGGQPVVGSRHPAARLGAQMCGPSPERAGGADAVTAAVEVDHRRRRTRRGTLRRGRHRLGWYPADAPLGDRGAARQQERPGELVQPRALNPPRRAGSRQRRPSWRAPARMTAGGTRSGGRARRALMPRCPSHHRRGRLLRHDPVRRRGRSGEPGAGTRRAGPRVVRVARRRPSCSSCGSRSPTPTPGWPSRPRASNASCHLGATSIQARLPSSARRTTERVADQGFGLEMGLRPPRLVFGP